MPNRRDEWMNDLRQQRAEHMRRRYQPRIRRKPLDGGVDRDRSRTITQEQLEHAHDSNAYALAMYEANQDAPPSGNRAPSPYVPTPGGNPIFNKEKAIEHNERARQERESARNGQSASGGAQTADTLPDIDEIKTRYATEAGGIPIHPVDIEAQIAAQHNPVLREIRFITEHEGIPVMLQGNIDACLRLCGDYGIDEENDAEAKAFLEQIKNDGSYEKHEDDALSAARREALESFGTDNARESFTAYKAAVEEEYGVTFNDSPEDTWDLANIVMAHTALGMAASVFGDRLREMSGLEIDDALAFQLIFGPLDLNLSPDVSDQGAHAKVEGSKIIVFWNEDKDRNYNLLPYVLLHELGHRFNFVAGLGGVYSSLSMNETVGNPRSRDGMGESAHRLLYEVVGVRDDHGMYGAADQPAMHREFLRYGKITEEMTQEERINEYTADGVLNWIVYLVMGGESGFAATTDGQDWLGFIDENMDAWIMNAIVYNAHEQGIIASLADDGLVAPIAGTGEVLESQDPNRTGANVRSLPARTGDRMVTLREKESVLLLDQIAVEGDIPWNAVWAHGVNYVRADLLRENWIEGYPKNEDPGKVWFPTLLELLVERMTRA